MAILFAWLVAAASFAIPVLAGQWMRDGSGWWYREDDGSWPAAKWREIGGKWYYFDGSGYMAANRWIDSLYYVGADGAMLADAVTPDGYGVGADGRWIPQGGAATGTSLGNAGALDWNSLGRAYQEKIQDEIRQGMADYYDEGSRGGYQFTLLYFDGDDTPEMALWYDYKTQDGSLYGYKNGKAFLIDGINGYLSYVPGKNYMEAGDYRELTTAGYKRRDIFS